ncbi:cell division protein FtsL [Neomoorella thermoacetica]|uniref:cell division protein FtsL n=1 Tax=Neomoorella thermoacetica TaxID=1525 RepID=UPI0008FAC735|nr:cell division protein FtsL [Moorella thermoacetica]OIQ12458.1 cell division protein FtsL [Moorella thermoacetica]
MLAAPRELSYIPQPVVSGKQSPRSGLSNRRRESRARQKILLLGLVLMGVVIGLSLTFLTMQVLIKGYKIDSLKRELSTLQRENEQLQLEVARLKAPERVARVATTKLGMVEPKTEQIYYVPEQAGNGKQVQVATTEPSRPAVTGAAPGRQAWWVALAEALHQWLEPARQAGAGV